MLDELKKLSLKERCDILDSWDKEDITTIKTVATQFKEKIKPRLERQLNEKLGNVLPSEFFNELNAQYEYFPKPILYLSDMLELSSLKKNIEKYLNEKSTGHFSKNKIKEKGAKELLDLLNTPMNDIESVHKKITETLNDHKNPYFSLNFDTWFFVKERQSALKGYYQSAKVLLDSLLSPHHEARIVSH